MNNLSARDAFSGLHPGPCYLFFGFVLLFTVAFMHPAVLGVSFLCATAYAVYLGKGKAVRFTLAFLVPVMIVAAVLNPAFNHRGATVLFYLWTGNPVTLESLLYGVAGALMIGAVIQWCYCYSVTMTSDKFLWLFGRVAPSFALVISMALRLIPRYTVQARRIASARAGLGRGVGTGSIIARARGGLAVFSIMTTWALENTVDTADSMLSRGYGTRRRTAYSNYRLARRDGLVLGLLGSAVVICVLLVATGAVSMAYFPVFTTGGNIGTEVFLVLIWAMACLTPLVLGIGEDVRWRSLRSRI
ncbi:MAG: energy-coupling factor transporter transmembrane protein EcfT [Coriobacteriales bacterium]|nr:energy-coupling factor transporter transmembrane protein EcfT [Coriobacteriales bacterium]